MVRATLQKRAEDEIQGNGRYWSPNKVGDELHGTIIEIKEDDYQNDRCVITTLDGDEKETPAHKDFLEYVPQLREGDEVWITATGFEEKEIKDRQTGETKKVKVWTYQVDIDEPEQEVLE
jgi:hypothetical protein